MKTIKDLTSEEVIEIAKLTYGFPDWIKSDFELQYSPHKERDEFNLEEFENVVCKFKAYTFGETIDTIRVTIYSNLDVTIGYLRPNTGEDSLPVRNQYKVQKLLMESQITPKYD